MKKVLLSFAALLFSVTMVLAQGATELKAAAKAYDAFALNGNDLGKLKEAVDNIAVALTGAETMNDPVTYLEAGDIYAAVMNQMVIARTSGGVGIINADDIPKVENPAAKSAEAYLKSFELFEKKGKKKLALKGLTGLQGNLSNAGIFGIQDKDYANAYENFAKSIAVHEFVKGQGGESFLDGEGKLNDETYYAAVSALLSEKMAEAKPLYTKLVEVDYSEPGIYDGLYKIYLAEGNKDKALEYLNTGREKHPDDTQLLFTEINYYLTEKKLDELITKLGQAIEKEPDNVSLYATMGSVYDNLYQREAEAGNEEKAAEYFASAKNYYEQALAKKPDYSSAVYSIGALYFNRAAAMTQELSVLEEDLSREGQKKYEALKEKANEEFNAALPYFKQAEQMDPNDLNVLIALKEIYARQSDFEKSNEFKSRLETVQGGGTVESYFGGN